MLARIELSSDRTKATLFYLETVPGSARIRVTFDGNGVRDFLGYEIDADGDGLPGGVATIEFDTLSQTPFPGTIVCGRVFASELQDSNNVPLAGVIITADGLEQEVRATTDAFGNFRITNAPLGHFFVHIDGRTVTNVAQGIRYPDMAYYPSVGKQWESLPGGETNIGNVYLPLIAAHSLHPVSATTDTVVTFPTNVLAQYPELQGVTVTIPANALFSDNGTRGGMVGIAPVPPDRLPGPLPEGLNFPLVITVQTDGGQNFDRPVPVCFPNLPDRATGLVKAPGEKTTLWSFDHDTGQWEARGPMTVSADGRLVCSDPGIGLLSPGWHGVADGGRVGGGPPMEGTCQDPNSCGVNRERSPCPPSGPPNPTNPVHLQSGEKEEQIVDLHIRGVGMDFNWTRTYNSSHQYQSAQGHFWDFNYNMYVYPGHKAAFVANGATRIDEFHRLGGQTNIFARLGLFEELVRHTNGTYTLITADRKLYNFSAYFSNPEDPFIARSSYYKLSSIIDRNNNTYSKKSSTNRFGHKMLTITDGRRNDPNDPTFGQGPYVTNEYATVYLIDRSKLSCWDAHFLLRDSNPGLHRVHRQTRGGDNVIDLRYERLTGPETNFASMRSIANDGNGNVTEYFYDSANSLVRLRQFTGRANPTGPTHGGTNRPASRLRPSDPGYFETRHEYNRDWLRTRTVHPNGNITEYVYESDLDARAPARARGNLRRIRHLPGAHQPAGDQSVITEEFEYDTTLGCGGCGFNFVTRHTDARGNVTTNQYDSQGNLTNRISRIASIVESFAYNSRGQLTRRVHPDNGSGYRRVDVFRYYVSGHQAGYLQEQIVDFGGFNLITRFEYDAVGNVTRVIDPRGHDNLYVYNALNQVVREISRETSNGSGIRYQKDFAYDANNNLIRVDVENRDENGVLQPNTHLTTTFEYDVLNYLTRLSTEIEPGRNIVEEYGYDANRNRTLVRYGEATAGRQPGNIVRFEYDERNLLFQRWRAPGTSDQSIDQFDYDPNGNLARQWQGVLTPGIGVSDPRISTFVYDGDNRLVASVDPMGNIVSNRFDARNLTNTVTFGELVDLPGAASNVRLYERSTAFDPMNRLVHSETAFFDPATQTPIGTGKAVRRYVYSDSSQLVQAINENNHTNLVSYDTALRRHLVIDAKGNRMTYAYDANNNVIAAVSEEKSDLGGPVESFTTHFAYDNLNRLISTTDNIGNVSRSAYDSRGNLTVATDANTNVVRYAYDGLNRLVQMAKELTQTGVGGSPIIGAIVEQKIWDDSSRVIGLVDANNNLTRYLYDGLGRTVSMVMADDTYSSNRFDSHDNLVQHTDANGSIVNATFDLNNRVIRRDIAPGPGVATSTTFEVFKYDGLSRLTHAEDNDLLVTRAFDSLSHLTRETQNGFTTTAGYDGAGNRTNCVYPSLRTLTTTFDELERQQTISDGAGLIASYEYVGPDRVAQRGMGNGTVADYAYNGVSGLPNAPNDFGVRRLTEITHRTTQGGPVFASQSFTYDRVGQRTRQEETAGAAPAQTRDYGYDSAYRLVRSLIQSNTVPVVTNAYVLDGAGNRSSVAGEDAGSYTLTATTPEPADRQLNQYSTTPFDQRTYDRKGNLQTLLPNAGGQRSLSWDYANRLVAITDSVASVTHTYRYDALGRRFEAVSVGTGRRARIASSPSATERLKNGTVLGRLSSHMSLAITLMNC